jgi:predicted metal-dependent peptidase
MKVPKCFPKSIQLFHSKYKITYCKNASEVDIHNRESLFGQVDFWTKTIRIFINGREIGDIKQTLIHEVLHAIKNELKINFKDDKEEDIIDRMATGMADFLRQNPSLYK